MPESIENFGIGGQLNQVVGPAIASAATVAPTHKQHIITGAVAIVNITPPWPGFADTVYFIAGGIFTWTAAGNINTAGTSTAVGRVIPFTYNPVTAKWSPHILA